MKKFASLVLILLAACTESMPENAIAIPESVIEEASEAWASQGLVVPEHCAAPLWAVVSFEEYRDQCPSPSCGDPSVGPVGPTTTCTHACTHFLDDGRAASYFAGVASKLSKVVFMSEPEIQAHETWHVWLNCQGDTDLDHTQTAVWSGAAKAMHGLDAAYDLSQD